MAHLRLHENLSERRPSSYSIRTLVDGTTLDDAALDGPPKLIFEKLDDFEEMNDLLRPIVVNPKYALAFLFAYFLRCFLLPWIK